MPQGVQVQPLLPAPADRVGTLFSGVGNRNPNLITRRWGSDLFLFSTPSRQGRHPILGCRQQKSEPYHTTMGVGFIFVIYTRPTGSAPYSRVSATEIRTLSHDDGVRFYFCSLHPADRVGTLFSGVGNRNPNLITRRWGSDLSLFTSPKEPSEK